MQPDLLVTKQVNSAFVGKPDLDQWLRDRGCQTIAVWEFSTIVRTSDLTG